MVSCSNPVIEGVLFIGYVSHEIILAIFSPKKNISPY
jgi:hypothetical protein